MSAAPSQTADLAALTAQALPGNLMFNPPVLDAMMQATVDGTWATHWRVGKVLLELRVVAVGGQPVGSAA